MDQKSNNNIYIQVFLTLFGLHCVARLPLVEFEVKFRPLNSSQTDKISVFCSQCRFAKCWRKSFSDQRDESATWGHGQLAAAVVDCMHLSLKLKRFPSTLLQKFSSCHEFTGEIKLSLCSKYDLVSINLEYDEACVLQLYRAIHMLSSERLTNTPHSQPLPLEGMWKWHIYEGHSFTLVNEFCPTKFVGEFCASVSKTACCLRKAWLVRAGRSACFIQFVVLF